VLDIRIIRSNPDLVREAIKNKRQGGDIDEIIRLDAKRKSLTHEAETLRHERKTASKNIGALMKQGKADEAGAAKARVA
jgi:seryl-tRNA synthetase